MEQTKARARKKVSLPSSAEIKSASSAYERGALGGPTAGSGPPALPSVLLGLLHLLAERDGARVRARSYRGIYCRVCALDAHAHGNVRMQTPKGGIGSSTHLVVYRVYQCEER
jgi:hypothetical protein